MPFTRISLLEGKSPEYLKAVSDSLHQAMVEAFNVPADDRFQAIHQHRPDELDLRPQLFWRTALGRFYRVLDYHGKPRDTATKKAFYKRLVALLGKAPGVQAGGCHDHHQHLKPGRMVFQQWRNPDAGIGLRSML